MIIKNWITGLEEVCERATNTADETYSQREFIYIAQTALPLALTMLRKAVEGLVFLGRRAGKELSWTESVARETLSEIERMVKEK